MGLHDDLTSSFGDGFFDPRPGAQPKQSWFEVCVCGHLDKRHSPSVGGSYRLEEPETVTRGGEEWVISQAFLGCVGSLPPSGHEEYTTDVARETRTSIQRVNATCPCVSFQPVARVDRPNRYFGQRVPRDRKDPTRHPMQVGLRALHTHLSKRKPADPDRGGDPSWVVEEFDRRFVRTDAWVCGISRCTETDAWPIYVDGERSELRCAAHR
jgi:hypothetical protein